MAVQDKNRPFLINPKGSARNHPRYACPRCGNKVGGFYYRDKLTGNDLGVFQDKCCVACGLHIDWSESTFSDICKI